MGLRKYTDIEVRGVVYPTVGDAAAALGVRPDTVRLAVRSGRLHRLGVGRAGPEKMPICIRGFNYPDADAAAKAFGVSRTAIYQALYRGDVDCVGRSRFGRVPPNAKPFEIGGLRFASMAQASVALGFSPSYVSQSYRNGRREAKERILAAAMALAAKRPDLIGGAT